MMGTNCTFKESSELRPCHVLHFRRSNFGNFLLSLFNKIVLPNWDCRQPHSILWNQEHIAFKPCFLWPIYTFKKWSLPFRNVLFVQESPPPKKKQSRKKKKGGNEETKLRRKSRERNSEHFMSSSIANDD